MTSVPFASAQSGLPTSQPKRLTIIREEVKVGRDADHARNEAGWPAAFAKAQSPDYYIALTSMTGSPEAWFLVPFDSNTAEAASMKRTDKDPVLSAELARLAVADAEFINGVKTIQTVARPDLSLGKFPVIGKVRYYEISVFSVRQGHEQTLDRVIKTYGAVRKRVAPDSSYRFYTVMAGMPDPTYIVLGSVEDYGAFDQMEADHLKVFASATPEESAILAKWGDCVTKSETNRFRVDPGMSYVPQSVRDQDSDFWMAK